MPLRDVYEKAFQHFSLQVHLLQSVMSQRTPDGTAIEEARRRVEQAHAAYRKSRDLLAQFLLSHGPASVDATGQRVPARTAVSGNKPKTGGTEVDQRSRVERLAYRLWEEAGRPSGHAEEHWYLAERLVRNAA